MSANRSNLHRFIARVHRRWMVLRVLEHVGICVLIGCAICIVLVSILILQKQPALTTVAGALGLSAAAGLVLGLTRRPTRLQSAMEADRQLRLHDLLTTAISTESGAEPWLATVRALAENRCRELSPNALVLNRLGSRAWGGIGLTAALALTLGAISMEPQPIRAGAGHEIATVGEGVSKQTPRDVPANGAGPNGKQASSSASPRDAENNGLINSAIDDSTTAQTTSADENDGQSSGRSNETGGGAGRTADSRAETLRATPVPGTQGGSGETASGGGGATRDHGTQPVHGMKAGDGSATYTPAWNGSIAPADRDAARQALEAARVPDAYRDLVREYFSTDDRAPQGLSF